MKLSRWSSFCPTWKRKSSENAGVPNEHHLGHALRASMNRSRLLKGAVAKRHAIFGLGSQLGADHVFDALRRQFPKFMAGAPSPALFIQTATLPKRAVAASQSSCTCP